MNVSCVTLGGAGLCDYFTTQKKTILKNTSILLFIPSNKRKTLPAETDALCLTCLETNGWIVTIQWGIGTLCALYMGLISETQNLNMFSHKESKENKSCMESYFRQLQLKRRETYLHNMGHFNPTLIRNHQLACILLSLNLHNWCASETP